MIHAIGEFLGVEVITLVLGGVKTIGMAGVATNKGVIVHPRATDQQIARLEAIAKVPVGTGSVNMGSGLMGTGLLVNEKGYIAGTRRAGLNWAGLRTYLDFWSE